jgi:hypothetical protein
MRLWTLHPRYLDAKGLVALWREALLAKAVLLGKTRGYRRHPQLTRFLAHVDPIGAVNGYLDTVRREATRRGYRFDARKVGRRRSKARIRVTAGQIGYEWAHLRTKLERRAPGMLEVFGEVIRPRPHPLFRVVPGPLEPWEKPIRSS